MPLVVIAGQEYGTGSSRDWAAKGTRLLGVKAVIAQSFERIHRSNLVGMGVLPCQFKDGTNAASLGLDGTETFDLIGFEEGIKPLQDVNARDQSSKRPVEEVPITFASIRRSKSITTSTAGFFLLCCDNCWRAPPIFDPEESSGP